MIVENIGTKTCSDCNQGPDIAIENGVPVMWRMYILNPMVCPNGVIIEKLEVMNKSFLLPVWSCSPIYSQDIFIIREYNGSEVLPYNSDNFWSIRWLESAMEKNHKPYMSGPSVWVYIFAEGTEERYYFFVFFVFLSFKERSKSSGIIWVNTQILIWIYKVNHIQEKHTWWNRKFVSSTYDRFMNQIRICYLIISLPLRNYKCDTFNLTFRLTCRAKARWQAKIFHANTNRFHSVI